MKNCLVRVAVGVLAAGLMSVLPTPGAAGTSPPPTNVAQVTVTVQTRRPGTYPVVNPDDLRVYENNQSRPVVSWVAAKAESSPLDLTILMDDSIRTTVSLQFRDLANFFQTLPTGTRVQVAYASYGGTSLGQNFTTDYRLAAKALRVPVGAMVAGGSIYDSVTHVLKTWPQDGHRRALLLISDGIDINQGYQQSEPWLNMQLQRAIDLAQRTDVPIYTIFARGARSLERNGFLLINGQGCLARLSSETGGQSYFQGTHTPLAFAPYLNQFANDLDHQYVLSFQPLPAPKAGYQRLRVTTEVPDVRLLAPTRVYVPQAG